MSRTRSGILDIIDLTGIEDSNEEDDAKVVHPDRPEMCRIAAKHVVAGEASVSEAAHDRGERKSGAVAVAVDIANSPIKNRRVASVSPEITKESENDNDNDKNEDADKDTDDEDEDEEDAIEIIGESNPGTNPLLDFPHRREDCQRFDFLTHPERFCNLCFCYICDVPASDCSEWYHRPSTATPAVSKQKQQHNYSHCFAKHSDRKSRQKRTSVRIRKNTLRPRKRLLPPQRLRPSPDDSADASMVSIQTSTKAAPNGCSSPKTSVRIRKNNLRPRKRLLPPHRLRRATTKAASNGCSSPPVVPSPQSTNRNLWPRTTTILQPHNNLRPSPAYKIHDKPLEGRRESSFLSLPPPSEPTSGTLHHDLFLHGKRKQPNAPPSTAKSIRTTPSDRSNQSLLAQSTSVLFHNESIRKTHMTSASKMELSSASSSSSSAAASVSAHDAAKKKRYCDSPLQRKRPPSRHLPIPKVTTGKRKQDSAATTTQGILTTTRATPSIQTSRNHGNRTSIYTTHTTMSDSRSKTAKPRMRSSSHYTRSSGKTNAVKVPEMYGTLGAYWRGEPTKYAGIPYEIRTCVLAESSGSTYTLGTTIVVTPKSETRPLPSPSSSVTTETNSFVPHNREEPKSSKRIKIHRRRMILPLSSFTRNAANPLSRRMVFPLSSTRNASDTTANLDPRASTLKTMTKVVNKTEVGLPPTTDAPDKHIHTITATLEGVISYDSDSKCYSILGTWLCPWSKSFPPQKFGLVRSLREGEEGPTTTKNSSPNGSFDGYCLVTTMSSDAKGKALYHDRLVFESGVLLEFKDGPEKADSKTTILTNRKSLDVHGSGSNKFGAFLIYGSAQPCTSGSNNSSSSSSSNNLYTIALQKRYLPQPPTQSKHPNTVVPRRRSRTTRSNSVHAKGTIIRKQFGNGEYCEGEVVRYDPIHKHYIIQYTNGKKEDFDHADMKRHYKHLQRYSHVGYTTRALDVRKKLLKSWFVNNSFPARI